jgi:hypothetical protein
VRGNWRLRLRGNWRAGIRWMEIELSSGCIQLKGSLVICTGGVFGSVEGAKPFPSAIFLGTTLFRLPYWSIFPSSSQSYSKLVSLVKYLVTGLHFTPFADLVGCFIDGQGARARVANQLSHITSV